MKTAIVLLPDRQNVFAVSLVDCTDRGERTALERRGGICIDGKARNERCT
jgi:hypothetical protein